MKIPIRSMIVAPKGYNLISCDLAQAETYIVAWRSNNKIMKEALLNGKKSLGTDIHSITAKHFYKLGSLLPNETQRFIGKKGNHQCSYRGGWFKLMESINAESDEPPHVTVSAAEAKVYHTQWNDLYSLWNWWYELEETVRSTRTIRTIYGRKRTFYGPITKDGKIYKEATAYEPQSTIADHMLGAIQPEIGIRGGLRDVYNKIILPSKGDIRIINTAHDSCILECPIIISSEIGGMVVSCIKRPMLISGEEVTVPVDIEVGERWGELEKLKVS